MDNEEAIIKSDFDLITKYGDSFAVSLAKAQLQMLKYKNLITKKEQIAILEGFIRDTIKSGKEEGMKKVDLLLCSSFIELELGEVFRKRFGNRIKNAKVLWIPFAVNKVFDPGCLIPYFDKLASYGIDKNNIEIATPQTSKENKYDIIFVAGGNNQKLKKVLIETGWWEEIKRRIENGVFYIGDSAGTVLCGRGMEFSKQYEEHVEGVTNYDGYCFIDKFFIVHYQEGNKNYEVKTKIISELGEGNCTKMSDKDFLFIDKI